jgi:PIN domain nuclease of toxin-antitoxin system
MYLLDTHALVWAVGSPERLGPAARAAAQSRQVKVSVVSLWEMIVKKNRNTTAVRDPVVWWEQHITRAETEVIPIRVSHLAELGRLPDIHGDPFDRMLVAQAVAERCTLISADSILAPYGVPVVWS